MKGIIEKTGPVDTRTEAQCVRDNIKDFFKKNKISNKAVAEKIGISQPMFTYYFSGNALFPPKIAGKLSQYYGFDEYYLMNGSLEFVVDEDSGETLVVSHSLFGVNDENGISSENNQSREEIYKWINSLNQKLAIMQKKYKIAEEALYSANRMIASIGGALEAIADQVKYSNKIIDNKDEN